MAKNPGQIKIVVLDKPLRLFGHTIPIGKGEYSLLSLLNAATEEIKTSGEFESIVQRQRKIWRSFDAEDILMQLSQIAGR